MLSEDELQEIQESARDSKAMGGNSILNPYTAAKDIIALIAMIRELQAQVPRWIPVSERLPEMEAYKAINVVASAEVLVLMESGAVHRAHLNEFGNAAGCDDLIDGEVVAWMPIPDTSQVLEAAE